MDKDRDRCESEQIVASHHSFGLSHPTLLARQFRWQEWRGEEFERRAHELRNASRIALSHSIDRSADKAAACANEVLDAMRVYETRVRTADAATKRAIRAADAEAWAAALDECDSIMSR